MQFHEIGEFPTAGLAGQRPHIDNDDLASVRTDPGFDSLPVGDLDRHLLGEERDGLQLGRPGQEAGGGSGGRRRFGRLRIACGPGFIRRLRIGSGLGLAGGRRSGFNDRGGVGLAVSAGFVSSAGFAHPRLTRHKPSEREVHRIIACTPLFQVDRRMSPAEPDSCYFSTLRSPAAIAWASVSSYGSDFRNATRSPISRGDNWLVFPCLSPALYFVRTSSSVAALP